MNRARVGWICNECHKEVKEYVTSIGSAGGGGVAARSFGHVVQRKCRAQIATVTRIPATPVSDRLNEEAADA